MNHRANGVWGVFTKSLLVVTAISMAACTKKAAAPTATESSSIGKTAIQKIVNNPSANYKIANENQSFTVGANTVVQYGVDSRFLEKTVSGQGSCSNQFFGNDPAVGVAKACYVIPAGATVTTTTAGAKLADENQNFSVTVSTVVKYGAGSNFVQKTIQGSASCSNTYFGQDPLPGTIKACYVVSTSTAGATPTTMPPASGTKLADEGQNFAVSSSTVVQYGAGSKFIQKTVQGTASCTNEFFGNDPLVGTVKACYSLGASTEMPAPATPTAPTTTTPTSTGSTAAGSPVNADGSVNVANYDAMYAAAGTDAWVNYNRGPASVGGSGVKLYERPHKVIKSGDTQNAGQNGGIYEHGTPDGGDGGYYSTSQADVATFGATSGSGIVSLQTSGYTNNTGQLKPQPQWQRGFQIEHANLPSYRSAGVIPSGDVKPLFVASSNDASAQNGPSRLIGTANGSIIGVGSNTASNVASLKLAAGKLPVAGAVTTQAEFLFVPVWDKAARKGQVAVVIMCGTADGVDWTAGGLAYQWWDEWRECYPGLPNQGNTSFMKLLGYVDIPGMAAPTSAAVNTGFHPWEMLVPHPTQGVQGIGYPGSPIQDHYMEFRDGGSKEKRIARGGLLAVASKSEKKVVYFDLKPLFSWVYDSYYGANHTRGERKNLGMADNQWPQTFANSGVTMPVVKTMTYSDEVAAVKFTATRPSSVTPGEPFAYVVTNTAAGEGKVHINAVGGCVPGSANNKTCGSGDISERSVVGGLPYVSSIATMLGMIQTGNVDSNSGFWFVSRPNREVGFVRLNSNGSGGQIGLKYQTNTEQCADPVGLADIDNYSNESNAQLLMCYNDKKVATYRTDVLHHNGSWTSWAQNTPVQGTSGVPVEYYGAFSTSGKPYHALSANVP